MSDIKILLGKRIKELRKAKNLTQEKMSEIIGIEPNNLSRLENGKNFPTPENLTKIANALNVDIRELFTFNHLKSYDEIVSVLKNVLEKDEYKTRMIYRFWEAIK